MQSAFAGDVQRALETLQKGGGPAQVNEWQADRRLMLEYN